MPRARSAFSAQVYMDTRRLMAHLQAVATVFTELGGDQKAQILQALLAKVIGSATGR